MYDTLKSTKRQPKKVSSVKQLRNQGWVPGVIHGKGMESLMIQVELKDMKKFFSDHKAKVFEVEVTGDKKHLVSLDKVEKDSIGNKVMHVSFHHLERGQETSVMIPVVLTGEVQCTGKPADLPESVTIDVSHLDVHHHISLKDIEAPKGVKFHFTDNEQVILSCSVPKVQVIDEVVVTEEATTESTEEVVTTEEDKTAA